MKENPSKPPKTVDLGVKQPVKIRLRKLANGNTSLVLDTYHEGKRKFEILKLYLIPEKDERGKTIKGSKAKNDETMKLAKAIQAKRIVELQNGEFGFKTKKKSNANFIDFIEKLANNHLKKTGNKQGEYYNLMSLQLHLSKYAGNKIKFSMIDEKFVSGFVDYLKTAKNQNLNKNRESDYLAQNTQNKLCSKLNTVLKKAVREKIISENPLDYIDRKDLPKTDPATREYLTVEELKKLIDTDCKNEHVKRAFLFCCLTGLRFSDVSNIRWQNFSLNNSGAYELRFRMQKNKKDIVIQISNEATKWLPEKGEPTDKVFKLSKNEAVNPILSEWVEAAGINKDITFHCSRHTAATLNLSLGVPVAVVSKLMGHSKIATTEIYAKIVDKAQRAAVDKQDGLFD